MKICNYAERRKANIFNSICYLLQEPHPNFNGQPAENFVFQLTQVCLEASSVSAASEGKLQIVVQEGIRIVTKV